MYLAEELKIEDWDSQLRGIVGDANRNLVHNFKGFRDGRGDYPDIGVTAHGAADVGEQRAIHGAHFGLWRSEVPLEPTVNSLKTRTRETTI